MSALLALLLASAAAAEPAFPSTVVRRASTHRFDLYEVRFPSPVKSPFPANDTVWGHLYLPRRPVFSPPPGNKPACVLVLPIMAAPNSWIEMRFVRSFLRQGLAVMWIEMPYQFHRRPHPSIPSGQVFLARTPRRLGDNFRQSIADARRAIDWLSASGLVDPERLGVFGISMGAMVGSAAYSLDPRPKGAAFALGGADFPELLFASSMTEPFLAAVGAAKEDVAEAWKGIDPVEYAEQNRRKSVLLVNASSDRVIPAANGLKLKEAFPGSRQVWVPGGHYSAILHLVWMPDFIAYELAETLTSAD